LPPSSRATALIGAGDRGRLGQHLEERVEGVTGAATVQGGDRPRLAEPEIPEHRGIGLGTLVVDLVGDEHDRLARAPQQLDDGLIIIGGAHGRVDDEEHGIGQVDGHLGLLGDAQVDARRVDLPAAGVDEGEVAAGPVTVIGDAVTGHAGHVLDDGLAAADDAVDERGLADVGAAHDRDHRLGSRVLVDVALDALALEEGAVLLGELEVLQARA
jgi:hypothetical protein